MGTRARGGRRRAPVVIARPFGGAARVTLVLPAPGVGGPAALEGLEALASLLEREAYELEVELGAPVAPSRVDPGRGPRFVLRLEPPLAGQAGAEPSLSLDREAGVLLAWAGDVAGIGEALSLLRTLVTTGARRVTASDCRTAGEAVERLEREVATTYPAFALRGLDWPRICARHRDAALEAAGDGEATAALQRWVAELADAHTGVHPADPVAYLPYVARVDGDTATLERVPEGSAAFDAGVRAGDTLVGVDARAAWARTGAPAHARPYLAGRSLLGGPHGTTVELTARDGAGAERTFAEAARAPPWDEPASWQRLPSGTGYLRLRGWPPGVAAALDEALGDLAACERLIVDLRGNAGGALVEALDFRDRFVHAPGRMGSVRFSTGDGGLSAPGAISAEPAPAARRWHGRVRFLTDALTCSASEDALLGLQGLAHVEVVGTPSCGGSGRPRTVRLLPGTRLSVSTALTYDREGRCVEGAGITVDRRLDWRRHADLPLAASARLADAGW